MVLEKTLESPLEHKEIKPVNPKGNQSWIFIGRTDAEAENPILWPPAVKNWLIEKDPGAGKDWRQEEKGMTEDEMVGCRPWLNGHEFEQAPGVGVDKEAWRAAVHGVAKSWIQLSDLSDWLIAQFIKLKQIKDGESEIWGCLTSIKSHSCFKEIVLEQLNSHMEKKKKMKLDPYFMPYTKLTWNAS